MVKQSGEPEYRVTSRHAADKAARMLAIVVGVCAFVIVAAWLAYHAEFLVCP